MCHWNRLVCKLLNLLNFIYQQYCYQLYYSCFFCCFVEIKKIPLWSLFLIVYLHLQWNAVLTQIMLCLTEAVLRNSRFFCVNPYWISTRKVKKTWEALFLIIVGTFNFSAKFLSKKDSSTMLPELTEFVPATRMGIARKVL